jgi:hypothetical protein|nr:MAG TPA: hypothetical protein [Caudoviricetes sp.]
MESVEEIIRKILKGKIAKLVIDDKEYYIAKWRPIYKIYPPKYDIIFIEISEKEIESISNMIDKIQNMEIEILNN